MAQTSGIANALDLLTGRKTTGQIAAEQAAGAMPEPWKMTVGTIAGIIGTTILVYAAWHASLYVHRKWIK